MIDWLRRRTLYVASLWNVFVLFLIAFLFMFASFRPRIANQAARGKLRGAEERLLGLLDWAAGLPTERA